MIASSRSSFLQHGVHNGVVIYARCTGLLCWSCVAVRCSVLVVLCCLFASDASQLHDLASSDRQKLCKDDVHNAMRALRRPCAAVGCCSPSGCTLLLSAPAWHSCSVLVFLCCLFASDASQLHDLASSDRQKLCKDDVHNAMRALRRPCAAVGCRSPSGCTLASSLLLSFFPGGGGTWFAREKLFFGITAIGRTSDALCY